jgi:hypothetical protein
MFDEMSKSGHDTETFRYEISPKPAPKPTSISARSDPPVMRRGIFREHDDLA